MLGIHTMKPVHVFCEFPVSTRDTFKLIHNPLIAIIVEQVFTGFMFIPLTAMNYLKD
jgi:hypothetical protein